MTLAAAVAAVTALSGLVYYLSIKDQQLNLPPGPKPHLLLGNLLDFPAYHGWLKYEEWGKQYGDVIHLNVLGQHIIILNSIEASVELLEKRSSIYSSRPRVVMMAELAGWDYSFAFMPYLPRWRAYRRLFHDYFHEKKAQEYHSNQELNAHSFARNLLQDPSRFLDHIRMAFASVMLDVLYDIKVDNSDHVYIKTAEVAMEGAVASSIPGNFLVDVIPALKYVPSWFPGAGFQRKAAVWRTATRKLRTLPADVVRECMASGKGSASIMASMFNTPEHIKEAYIRDLGGESFDDVAMNVLGVSYGAGSDTTVAATKALLFALAKFPDFQKTAQAELDCITGGNRLPTIQDIPMLPYLNAFIKELLRWHTIVPLGIPHTATEDDVYNGMFIPKGSAVISNIWSIHHDPAAFSDPEKFDPSRWLERSTSSPGQDNSKRIDPFTTTFGFGRRICPGRHFANTSLLITAATVLSCFDISPALDASGKPVELKWEVSGEAVTSLLPFEIKITPRSERAVQLLNETEL